MHQPATILLMGPPNVGKTLMLNIIFQNWKPDSVLPCRPTYNLEIRDTFLLQNNPITIVDCGGRDWFFFDHLGRKQNFREVDVLVFAIDMRARNIKRWISHFGEVVKEVVFFNPEIKIYTLIHKMDLLDYAEHDMSIEQVKSELFDLYNQKINVYEKSHNEKPRELSWYKCYDTSCKDLPTLYEAWSDISQWTIRRQEEIQDKLKILLKTMDVTCLLLIERRTFLVLAYAETESKHSITDYYLRMIKDLLDLKPLINGTDNNDGRHILRDKYQAYVADFTLNTYLVVVTEDMTIQPNFIKLNVKAARREFLHFDELLPRMPYRSRIFK